MSFAPYPRYKASGAEWLGKVPEQWDVQRLGHFFTERREKVSDVEYAPLSVTKQGIVPQLETAAKTDDRDNRKRVCNGDFVINSRSDRRGSAGVSDLDGSVSLISIVLRPTARVRPRFIHHLLRSRPFQDEFYRCGKGIVADLWSTNYDEMRGIALAMPNLAEQEEIASFLDEETAKIDTLVAEHQRLIDVLKENRQAVISHAVTKGLNPDAPVKSTGLPWLGDVPAHWMLSQLRYEVKQGTSITYGIVQAGPHLEGGVPYIRTSDMAGRALPLDGYARTSNDIDEAYARSRVSAGDLVVAIRASVGKCLPVPPELAGANLTQGTAKVSPGDRLSSGYLLVFMNSFGVQQYLGFMAKGATFKEITLETLRKSFVLVPPLPEQRAIEMRIAALNRKYEQLIADAERAIALLQERRTAMISAAVTGKIDVRGLARADAVAA